MLLIPCVLRHISTEANPVINEGSMHLFHCSMQTQNYFPAM